MGSHFFQPDVLTPALADAEEADAPTALQDVMPEPSSKLEKGMEGFVEANRGSTGVVFQACEEELERMIDLRRERIGEFIANARAESAKQFLARVPIQVMRM